MSKLIQSTNYMYHYVHRENERLKLRLCSAAFLKAKLVLKSEKYNHWYTCTDLLMMLDLFHCYRSNHEMKMKM